MKHLFVPYELALQLKEKGFNKTTLAYYFTLDGKNWKFALLEEYNKIDDELDIGINFTLKTPLYQQVIDWFREKHEIIIEITSYFNFYKLDKKLYECALSHKDNGFEGLMQNASNRISVDWSTNPEEYNLFDDYYKGLNHIIQEALKLI